MRTQQISVSVDVDSLDLYLSIHGQSSTISRVELVDKTWELGVSRFINLFDELDIKATFFIVGQDLENPTAAETAKILVEKGHELANHTWSHPYNLTLLGEKAIIEQIERADSIIKEKTGFQVNGFRAPGYNTNDTIIKILTRKKYIWDASPLPSWPYLVAKYSIMAYMFLRAKSSASIIGNPLMGLGKIQPWIQNRILRIPFSVTSNLRIPYIGTAITSLPEVIVDSMTSNIKKQNTISLGLHAVDLIDCCKDNIPKELTVQKDINIPFEKKYKRISKAIEILKKTHTSLKLSELSEIFNT